VIRNLQQNKQSPGVHRVEAPAAGARSRERGAAGFWIGISASSQAVHRFSGSATPVAANAGDASRLEIRRWTEADYQPAAAVITGGLIAGHVDAQINDQYHTRADAALSE